ncbi:MAG: helix-turn-helix transcriptional regulator [Ruminiclostridium sp.]|nr:helix-turn-helix transcriptional regulator [Ruminiclostridium sp.]
MLKLGENIKKYRLKRELTQEQLAEAFGVSPQAVSRWENSATYPDITLLPTIASYFDVSIDEIIGFDITRKEEKIKEVLKKNRILHNNGDTKKSIELLRQALIDFPNESRLLYCLAQSLYSLYFQSGEAYSETDKQNAASETIELLKKALHYADENFDEGGCCRQMLVFNYLEIGEYEKAKEIAKKAPFMPTCREMLLPQTMQGKEATEEYQKNILYFTIGLYHNIYELRKRSEYSFEEKLEISHMAEKLLLLIGGENSGFRQLFTNALQILNLYVEIGDKEKAIKYLEKALLYADNCEKRPDKTKYDVPWLCYCENNSENVMKHSQESLYENLMAFISKSDLHSWMKDDKRFIDILEEIKSYC